MCVPSGAIRETRRDRDVAGGATDSVRGAMILSSTDVATPHAPIGDAEVSARIRRLQADLVARGLAGVVCFGAHRDYCPADLRYLARWSCTDEESSYLFVPRDGETTLVTDAEWDHDRARAEAFAGAVVLDRTPERTLTRLIAEHARSGDRVGISGFRVFPAPVFVAVAARCPSIVFEDASSITAAQRLVKSPAELGLLREAARISDLGMRAGVAQIREGAVEAEVAAAAEYAIRRTGADLSFVTVMGSGTRTAQATFFPTNRVMRRGEYAVLDCGARVEGYHGDMCRTVTVGGPTPEQRQALEAVKRAVEAAIDAARPGATVRQVHEAAQRAVTDAGLGKHWWGYYMPHGAGTGQHEPPAGLDDGELVLAEGMVLCVEPGITLPGAGAVILEQMITIGPDGAEVLNALPLDLWDNH